MIDFIAPTLSIVFDYQTLLIGSNEPHDYVYPYKGKIFIYEDTNDDLIKIGQFQVSLLDILNASENGYDAYDIFDVSEELSAFCNIYDANSLELNATIKEPLYDMHDEIVEYLNVLIIQRLEIYENFRGKKLGGLIIKALIKRFKQGVAVVALKPYPLQFEHNIDVNEYKAFALDKFSKSETTAKNKLTRYYQKLGFIKIPKTEIMVLNPNL